MRAKQKKENLHIGPLSAVSPAVLIHAALGCFNIFNIKSDMHRNTIQRMGLVLTPKPCDHFPNETWGFLNSVLRYKTI